MKEPIAHSRAGFKGQLRPADLVRLYYEYVDAADYLRVVELFAPDATYHRPGYPLLRGRSALREFYQRTRIIQTGRHDLHRVVGHGPVIAVAGTFTGTIVGDRNVSQGFADFFTVRDGLILARQTYFDSPAV